MPSGGVHPITATHEGLRSYRWGPFGEGTGAETLRNPAKGGVSEQIVGRSEGWIGFMREPCPVPHRASSCDQRTRRSRASPCFALIGGAFCLGCPKHRLVVVLFVIGLAGLLEA